MAAIVVLAFCSPALSPLPVAVAALMVATASATQDILIDAFRVESLPEEEQAAGMASYVAAYRVGALVSGAGTLFLVSAVESLGFSTQTAWSAGYVAMALLVLIGICTTLVAIEPEESAAAAAEHEAHAQDSSFKRVVATTIGAFANFFSREVA